MDSSNDGKLVHLSGKSVTVDVLKDGKFGVSANAIKLKRAVEMYQWKEKTSSKTKKKTTLPRLRRSEPASPTTKNSSIGLPPLV